MQRATLVRLESYLLYLEQAKANGKTVVTSEELAGVGGISSSRVRQDLIQIQCVGKPRSGYPIAELEMMIYAALDLLREKGMVLVGFGNLGRALAHSGIWEHAGFGLRAVFDNDRSIVGTAVGNVVVRHISELAGVLRTHNITSACLTVPASAAQSVANLLVSAGILGIWNFAPAELNVPPHVVVENQHLEQGLMTMSYLMSVAQRSAKGASLP